MAYKRRRASSGTSARCKQVPSLPPTCSRPHSVTRMSSVPRSIRPSSPRLPPLSQQKGISITSGTSRVYAGSSSREEDVIPSHEETEAEIQEREDLDALNEVVMAIEMKERGSIGCAYYIAREEKLCLMEDIKMAGLDIVETLKIHVQPTVVLISTRCEEKLEEYIGKEARGIDRGDDASMLVPSISF
jgi:DNA mismatch repair protein MSH5